MRDGTYRFSECKMFARNYSQIVRAINLKGNQLPNLIKDHNFLNYLWTEDKTVSVVDCSNGWNYDRRMFPNTVVMEV